MKTAFKFIGVGLVAMGLIYYFSPEAKKELLLMSKNISSIFKPSKKELRPQPLSQEDIAQLITNDIHRFALSINNKDMSIFYDHISNFWKKRTNVDTLNKVFAPFINSGIDLTGLKNMEPILDQEPKVTKNADLYVKGHYNTTPSVLHFKQTYYLEETGAWKLAEFFIEVKKR